MIFVSQERSVGAVLPVCAAEVTISFLKEWAATLCPQLVEIHGVESSAQAVTALAATARVVTAQILQHRRS
jgi:hypothetical protein